MKIKSWFGVRIALLGVVAGCMVVNSAYGRGGCVPQWDLSVGNPGPGSRVYGMTVFDDGSGSGPQLYVGLNTPQTRVMKRAGSSWVQVGADFSNGTVFDLAVYNGELYAGGSFTANNGVTLNRIGKWNGKTWVSVAGGMTGGAPTVYSMTVHNDGTGPALVAAGVFGSAGGVNCMNIAKWNGTTWAALGFGIWGNVSSNVHEVLSVGSTLYVGGEFSHAGGQTAQHLVNKIAQYNNGSWSALGTGMNFGSTVYTLAWHDDGGGPALYAGGTFTNAGGVAANLVARWSAGTWSALGTGVVGGGNFVRALASFDDGTGNALYAAGSFSTAGGNPASHIARWAGGAWSPVGAGINNGWVERMMVFDDNVAGGPDLYVGGEFTTVNSLPSSKIAVWLGCDGGTPVPGDINGDNIVNANDLLAVINAWGPCPDPCPPTCPADVSADCTVNANDLLIVINNWG